MTGCSDVIWITHSSPIDAAEYAEAIETLGFTPLHFPLLTIKSLDVPLPDLSRYKSIIFTSINGLNEFSKILDERTLPVYAVGEQTAQAAREAGFTVAGVGAVGAADLAKILPPEGRPYLHISGVDVAEEIKVGGLKIDRLPIYKAEKIKTLSDECIALIESKKVAAILFFSTRAVDNFVDIVVNNNIQHDISSIQALCLADSMLESARRLQWKGVRVAKAPNRTGMLKLLNEFVRSGNDMNAITDTEEQPLANAGEIIERFGGIRPMAKKVDVAVTTVQGWKKRDIIPAVRKADVLKAAQEHDVDLSDLLTGSGAIANENTRTTQDVQKPVEEKPPVVEQPKPPQPKPSAPPIQAQRSPLAERYPADKSEDLVVQELMKMLKMSESRAVQTSVWISAVLVTVAAIALVFIMRPSTDPRLGTLENRVEQVEAKQQGLLGRVVPDDWQDRIAGIEGQAKQLQQAVGELTSPEGGALSERLGKLEDQVGDITGSASLANLIGKLQTMSQTAEGQASLGGAAGQLQQLVSGLQGQPPEDIERALQNAQQQPETELGATLQGVSPTELKAASMLIGLSQMRQSLNRDKKPFKDDVALLVSLMGDGDPELKAAVERLAPKAEQGVLTPKGLSGELRGLTGDIVVASIKGEDVSLKEKAMARLGTMLKVEKDGKPLTGTDTQATVDRAQNLIDQGDIHGAIAELQTLDGAAAEKAAPWIDDAQSTLLAQNLQSLLTDKVLGQINGGKSIPMLPGQGFDLKGLTEGAANVIPGGHVVTDPQSGFRILPQQGIEGMLPDQVEEMLPGR